MARRRRRGSGLPALFAEAGLREPTFATETFTILDPERATHSPFPEMATSVADSITAGEADTWLTQLHEAGRQGRFLSAATTFAVATTRPT